MTTIRTVMGIKGEPSTPADPSLGLVWNAIVKQVDHAGSQSTFISVSDTPRSHFSTHPWSIGGGGAAELKELIDIAAQSKLKDIAETIGPSCFPGVDEVFIAPATTLYRTRVPRTYVRRLILGDAIRDWAVEGEEHAFAPYDGRHQIIPLDRDAPWTRRIWPYRSTAEGMVSFDRKTRKDLSELWWSWYRWIPSRFQTPLGIAFGFVATHNHFVLDHGGNVFKQSSPVLKLGHDANAELHAGLIGLFNSSIGCFWLKQIGHNKGSTVDEHGARQRTAAFEDFFEFTATMLEQFPIPAQRPVALARVLDELARAVASNSPATAMRNAVPSRQLLEACSRTCDEIRGQMISVQEELDWECYRLYGLLDDAASRKAPPSISLGQRAFEIVLARKLAAGEEETTWFNRHGSTPITEIPAEWPDEYKHVVLRRIELIESDHNIALIERPEYKRRWNTEPWEEQERRALRAWLLDRLERCFDLDGRMNDDKHILAHAALRQPRLTSVAQVADMARADRDFMQVAELNVGRMDFDVANLVGELIAAESVPALPVLRYKPGGLDKRAAWERTWDLQRAEDAIDAMFDVKKLSAVSGQQSGGSEQPSAVGAQLAAEVRKALAESCVLKADGLDIVVRELVGAAGYVAEAAKQKLNLEAETVAKPIMDAARRAKQAVIGDIPVPPKYTSADFLSSDFWRLRGKLDVPKERWVSFPYCEGEDGTLVIAWAGYDHLQLARAIAERYEHAKEQEGRKLVPLLAAIGQLIPWLKQWHNDLDPAYGTRMGDYFENYLAEEAKALGKSVAEVMAWTPPAKTSDRRKRPSRRP